MVEGLWLKVAAGLPDSDSARVLGRRLEVDRAWSFALSTWDWFVRKHPEGELVGPDAAYLIAQGAGWQGDADKFCAAMVAAGYLAPIPEGFRVRGWSEWAGYHLEVRSKDKTKKKNKRGQSKGSPRDVPGTGVGQVAEKKAPEGVCPGDPSLLSTLGSGVSGSEGVQGEESEAKWPLIAACLMALWERKRDARWPAERRTADQLERLISTLPLPEAIERLDASLEADPGHPWLGWHLDALKPKRKASTRGDLGAEAIPWNQRLSVTDHRAATEELHALAVLDPDLECAPLGIPGNPASPAYEAIQKINAKWRAIAEARP
jgi:hypothetical protein